MIILDSSINKTLIHEAANCSSQLQKTGCEFSQHVRCDQHLQSPGSQYSTHRPCTLEPRSGAGSEQTMSGRISAFLDRYALTSMKVLAFSSIKSLLSITRLTHVLSGKGTRAHSSYTREKDAVHLWQNEPRSQCFHGGITATIAGHIGFTFNTETLTHPIKITGIMASFIFHMPSAQRIVLYMMILDRGATYLYIIKKGKWKKRKNKKKVIITTTRGVSGWFSGQRCWLQASQPKVHR